ncbi:MAG TPA: hypothetical protein PKY12_11090 [Catalimonadaceae bacterium]|nr:hypothetical protein [Catalimonadaceae bacterium]
MRFDEMRQNDPTKQPNLSPDKKEENNRYETPGYARALRLVWPDGKRIFLHYSYLVSGECTPDETTVSLVFSSQTVTIKGRNLGELFEEISQQLVREISCVDERYNETLEEKEMVVNAIEIQGT